MRNLILKPFHGFCENLHHRKFPAIRYIDFLILLIPTPLVSVLFYSSIPTFCSFKKNVFRSLIIMPGLNVCGLQSKLLITPLSE